MTVLLTKDQNASLAMLNTALYLAANNGLLEKIVDGVPSSVINQFSEAVGKLCTQAQVSDDASAVDTAGHSVPHGFGPQYALRN